jgi:patatin-like phospholipase/acyl hydrolase
LGASGPELDPGGGDVAITRVLAVDGGGVRGIIPSIVLERLCAEPGLDGWLDRTNLIAGTSTGGLIALLLGAGIEVPHLRDLYEQQAGEVFKDSVLDDIKDLGKLIGAEYHIANLEKVLHKTLGDKTLDQLAKRVLVTAFDLDNDDPVAPTWKPKLFHNYPGDDSDGDALAYRVGTATSAAPTYFEAYDGYIDGGVFATNPAMCALAQVLDPRIKAERAELHEVRLLSLGTGHSLQHIEGNQNDWGYVQWVRPLINLMLDGVNGIADFQCKQILGDDQYHRLAPTFPPGKTIDQAAIDEIPYLRDFALQLDLSATADWLRKNWVSP